MTEASDLPVQNNLDDAPFIFAAEGPIVSPPESLEVPSPSWIDVSQQPAWKVLVVDDEEGVHSVTRLALRHFTR